MKTGGLLLILTLVGGALAMTWVLDPFLVDSCLGVLSQHGVRRGMEDNDFELIRDDEELIIGRRGHEELRYHFVGDETVSIEYRRPLRDGEKETDAVVEWTARIEELYYTDEIETLSDGSHYWMTTYGDFHLVFSDEDGRRYLELTIDWPDETDE